MIALSWLQSYAGALLLAGAGLYALALLLLDGHRRTQRVPLRAIPFYDRLRTLTSRALETDTPLHLSLGSGTVLDAAPQVAASCSLAASLANAAMPPAVCTCGSPTLYAAAAGVLARQGAAATLLQESAAAGPHLTLVGTDPAALAAGAWAAVARQRLAGEVCLGPFGAEGLLLTAGSSAEAPERLVGTAEMDAAGVLLLGASAWVVGEDVYAASARTRDQGHQGGLALQDALRIVLLLAILAGLGLRLAGWAGF